MSFFVDEILRCDHSNAGIFYNLNKFYVVMCTMLYRKLKLLSNTSRKRQGFDKGFLNSPALGFSYDESLIEVKNSFSD